MPPLPFGVRVSGLATTAPTGGVTSSTNGALDAVALRKVVPYSTASVATYVPSGASVPSSASPSQTTDDGVLVPSPWNVRTGELPRRSDRKPPPGQGGCLAIGELERLHARQTVGSGRESGRLCDDRYLARDRRECASREGRIDQPRRSRTRPGSEPPECRTSSDRPCRREPRRPMEPARSDPDR